MELREIVIMDVTEVFATTTSTDQDLPKPTDFFDFVSHPDPSNLQDFQKQMRSVNVFLDNGTEDHKETNNNNMLISEIPTTTSDGTLFDTTLWNEKDTVRLETAILEDLNKYCWQNDEINGVVQIKPHTTHNNNNNNNNTDGQIYTLTVLNGLDQNTTWYRPPINVKEEEVSMSSPSTMEQLQTNLDIDSFLNIIPSGQITGYSHSYNEETMSPNTDGLIKSETYTYEDSGFADNKEELANQLMDIDTPLLEAHDSFNNNNNNNDWKLTNNNNTQSSSVADSLLRSALQGKAFVRYNGATNKASNGSKVIVESNNVELKRVLSSPTKTETIFIGKDDSEQQHIPTIVAAINANGKVIFEEQGTPQRHLEMIDTTSSTHSMDDILLSQLDHPFEDFEKLKRIANEVAESVNQYCIESTPVTVGSTVQGSISSDDIGLLYDISSPMSTSVSPIVTSTKPPPKKYKRSNSTKSNPATVQSATSTSNGVVRKERSLHYCSICSKGFKDKYSVNVHIRTHTGEKPFACSLCGKTFRQKAHLAKHYQTHIAQKNAAAAGSVGSAKTKSR